MCGIAGIVCNDHKGLENIKGMTDIIAHRGPDGCGYYYGDNFAFGHRRLAIIDLSEHGAQPMSYGDKYVITFNGEIYNHIELAEELKSVGYSFISNCDTEVILAAYDYWGEECLERFNGMWAFAIYNKEKNLLFCSRDRFGVKPFYYIELKDMFLFGSEIKQFSSIEGWKAAANLNRIYDFFIYGLSDHTNETAFQNVFQLRGGEKLIYDLHTKKYSVSQWYNLKKRIKKNKIGFLEAKDLFKSLFIDAVSLRMRSDVKIGSCLSGGLDSSSIVCGMNQLLKCNDSDSLVHTVSSCFELKKYDEQEYIDEVIQKTGAYSHKVFPAYKDLFSQLDKITWHQDEPFGSTSIYSQWNVFKCAQENGIKVMLDGQGADEQLAGYDGFFTANFNSLLTSLKWGTLHKEMKEFKKIFKNKKFNPIVGLAYSVLASYFPGIASTIAKKLRHGNEIGWLRLDKSVEFKVAEKLKRGMQRSIFSNSISQISYTNLPALLHYEDRNSMAFSIESRVPFVDYRIVEFVLSLPDEYKIKDAKTKYVLREAMIDLVPEKIINRHDKLGFETPEEVWIRDNPEDFRKEIEMACDLLGSIVDKERVLAWFESRLQSNKSFGYGFWKIISVARWAKVFEVVF